MTQSRFARWSFVGLVVISASGALAEGQKLALNWKPECEFGGFYQAQLDGDYSKNGLKVEIQPGGAGTPVPQMLAAGQIDFGVMSGDDVLLAREQGQDLVAIFSVYQSSPHGILTHEDRGFKTLADVFKNPGTLAIQQGTPFAMYLAQKYAPLKVKLVPYSGGVSLFLNDKTFSQQGFITSESLSAKRQGAKVKTFLVSESGFDPYVEVVAVRGDFLKKNEALVRAFVAATLKGWKAFMKDPVKTNEHMHKLNPTLDLATFAESAQVQMPFLENKDGKIGEMKLSRWEDMIRKLKDLKVLKKDLKAQDAFRSL